jgi:phosphoserine phosphatase
MSMELSWDHKLAHAVAPVRGKPMQTLAEAGAFVLALPQGVRYQDDWEHAADLLLAAADSGRDLDIEQATFQLERALFLHGLLAGR